MILEDTQVIAALDSGSKTAAEDGAKSIASHGFAGFNCHLSAYCGAKPRPLTDQEGRAMPMLEEKETPEINLDALETGPAYRGRRQMLLALVLLLSALILVLVKYREFWFPPESTTATQTPDQTTPDANPPKRHGNARGARAKHGSTGAKSNGASTLASTSVSNPVILNPLQVEVMTSGGRQSIRTQSASVSVGFPDPTVTPHREQSASVLAADATGTDASESFRLSPEAAKLISVPVSPTYPVLAKQMNVQGSVVLQALVEKDGNIQDVKVLSGPDILSSAAVEAVKQWHFKPYYQAGQPVQSQVEITVNFTITTQ
jgi:TonB family protein